VTIASRLAPLYTLGREIFRQFGYEAAQENATRRRSPPAVLQSEDRELDASKKARLTSSIRDLRRNSAAAAWMLRKHLDYVSTFSFQSRTGNRDLDRRVERFMEQWAEAENCDATARHPLPLFVRNLELRRTEDGDVGILRLTNGQLQAIEGDRIRQPPLKDGGTWIDGVKIDSAGRAVAYAIHRRKTLSSGFVFDKTIPAAAVWLHGYFDRFDQTRGVSPLAPAANALRDLHEGLDYSLAKMKVSQLFGLALYRASDDTLAPTTAAPENPENLQVDFGRGPFQLDLDPADKAEFLESKTPSIEFQQWTQTVTALALKSLDIPFSFWSENFTNFSGQRQAWIQYDFSARAKRHTNRQLLDKITRWRLALAQIDGDLPTFPLEDRPWRWAAQGVPWIDPLKEIQADVQALAAGLTSRQRILLDQGEFLDEIVDELAAEAELFKAAGLDPTLTANTPSPILEVTTNAPA
jgi:capsid protein